MNTFRFSANTGFLWKELPFLERIKAASIHDFQAVEFHDEAQLANLSELMGVLAETELPVCGMNTRMGETAGCAAMPGQIERARHDIDSAIALATRINARAIHVVAGKSRDPMARDCFLNSLEYALENSTQTILIEPLSELKVPGYFLYELQQASSIISDINHPRLKIMFDCFHVQQQHGKLLENFRQNIAQIGHVQIASFPDRSEPLPEGILNYATLLPAMQKAGYSGYFGCEYTPANGIEAGLNWRSSLVSH